MSFGNMSTRSGNDWLFGMCPRVAAMYFGNVSTRVPSCHGRRRAAENWKICITLLLFPEFHWSKFRKSVLRTARNFWKVSWMAILYSKCSSELLLRNLAYRAARNSVLFWNVYVCVWAFLPADVESIVYVHVCFIWIVYEYTASAARNSILKVWSICTCIVQRGGGLGSRPIFKKFHETYAPS